MGLRAVVIGSGWAGDGHTQALHNAGVDVLSICGRSAEPTRALAKKHGVPEASLDWPETLSRLRPDIVAIATTAAPHREMALAAAEYGCHIFCDKPLGLDATEAREMLAAVRKAGVKHAYGPASCLGPAIAHARNLIDSGLIGSLTGIESSNHLGGWNPAFNWFHLTSLGGGMLNNVFTHKLAQAMSVTGGRPTHVAGEARSFVSRAPVGDPVHDFRTHFGEGPKADEDDPTLWRAVDTDTSYSIVLQFALPAGSEVSARFDASMTSKSEVDDTMTLYGTTGTLVLTDGNSPRELRHFDLTRGSWEKLVVPPLGAANPWVEDYVQRDWNILIERFAADISGDGAAPYPTFEDGVLAAEIIDLVRSGRARVPLPARGA